MILTINSKIKLIITLLFLSIFCSCQTINAPFNDNEKILFIPFEVVKEKYVTNTDNFSLYIKIFSRNNEFNKTFTLNSDKVVYLRDLPNGNYSIICALKHGDNVSEGIGTVTRIFKIDDDTPQASILDYKCVLEISSHNGRSAYGARIYDIENAELDKIKSSLFEKYENLVYWNWSNN